MASILVGGIARVDTVELLLVSFLFFEFSELLERLVRLSVGVLLADEQLQHLNV